MNFLDKIVISVAKSAAKLDVKTVCPWITFQEKQPKEIIELRKSMLKEKE